jgi:hypothetical protein
MREKVSYDYEIQSESPLKRSVTLSFQTHVYHKSFQ